MSIYKKKKHVPEFGAFFCFYQQVAICYLKSTNTHKENIYFCIFNVRFLYVYSTSDMFS